MIREISHAPSRQHRSYSWYTAHSRPSHSLLALIVPYHAPMSCDKHNTASARFLTSSEVFHSKVNARTPLPSLFLTSVYFKDMLLCTAIYPFRVISKFGCTVQPHLFFSWPSKKVNYRWTDMALAKNNGSFRFTTDDGTICRSTGVPDVTGRKFLPECSYMYVGRSATTGTGCRASFLLGKHRHEHPRDLGA